MIGSTANYIATGLKWRRGEPWLEEIRVPANLPWEETDLSIKHPRADWTKWGVTYPDGQPLPNDAMPTSVLLPMGATMVTAMPVRMNAFTRSGRLPR